MRKILTTKSNTGFSAEARKLIAQAYQLAERAGRPYVGTEHFLLAIAQSDASRSTARQILEELNINAEKIETVLQKIDPGALNNLKAA